MKIVLFAPHGDDEIYAAGGTLLKWLDEGHDVHIIYVTDNRVWLEWGIKEGTLIEENAKPYMKLSGEEMAQICIKESKEVIKALDISEKNVHFYKFPDQEAKNNIELGISLSKEIIKNADRIVMPSDNNNHVDHQATHIIAKRAAQELNLKNIEYYVYALYNILKAPNEKQIKIPIKKFREKKYEIMKLYKTQLCLEDMDLGWKNFKFKRFERFGVFNFKDMGKYENF